MSNDLADTEKLDNKIPDGLKSEVADFDFSQFVPYLLNRATLAILPLFQPTLKAYDVSLAGWRILATLHKSHALRVRELLHLTGLEPPTLSRTLADLEQRQLVLRRPSEEDARGIVVEITPDGITLAEASIPDAIALQKTALRDFSADETVFLIRLLKRMQQNVTPDA
ncbi:MAG TPA: MarR family transcriptional regulator [Beijerinckiaceae bacterium]|jgi:DNA-binding MarR family transcriptional regulator|nr:MarR family transcriptional regulator [Beijerinckiaceae bacterium]